MKLRELKVSGLFRDQLLDDEGEPICDGQMVRVNGDYIGKVHVDGGGLFHIDGWPRHILIQSLEVTEP